ncbi:hypothetical protein BS78_10G076000 [Paspalum vaginatum]|nr:hypothetical protein BS78_10G076000 [Paspalum vaginatum]
MAALSPQQIGTRRSPPALAHLRARHLFFPSPLLCPVPSSDRRRRRPRAPGANRPLVLDNLTISRLYCPLPSSEMAGLNDAAQFALCVAIGTSQLLKPLLEFVAGVDPPSPALNSAVAVVTVALPLTYLTGVLLLQLQVARVPAGRFAGLACVMVSALLALLAVPLAVFWLLTPPPPPRGGL